jgi:hypothetical protein
MPNMTKYIFPQHPQLSFHDNSLTKMLFTLPFLPLVGAREIVFPPTSGYSTDQAVLRAGYNDPDISQARFAGMSPYANLPYVHCLAGEGEEVERLDIAVLGAPFDTVSSRSCIVCMHDRGMGWCGTIWLCFLGISLVGLWMFCCGYMLPHSALFCLGMFMLERAILNTPR